MAGWGVNRLSRALTCAHAGVTHTHTDSLNHKSVAFFLYIFQMLKLSINNYFYTKNNLPKVHFYRWFFYFIVVKLSWDVAWIIETRNIYIKVTDLLEKPIYTKRFWSRNRCFVMKVSLFYCRFLNNRGRNIFFCCWNKRDSFLSWWFQNSHSHRTKYSVSLQNQWKS